MSTCEKFKYLLFQPTDGQQSIWNSMCINAMIRCYEKDLEKPSVVVGKDTTNNKGAYKECITNQP